MADKYGDLLKRSWDDLPQPAPYLPEGTWLLKGRNVAYFPADEENDKSERVVLFFEPLEPMDDVKQEELDALGPNYDYANNDVTKQFYINRAKDWVEVRKILNLMGIETEGQTQEDSFKAFKGAKVLAYLSIKTFQNKRTGERVITNDPVNFAEAE